MGVRSWVNWLLRYRDQETVELAEGIHLAPEEQIRSTEEEIAEKRADGEPRSD